MTSCRTFESYRSMNGCLEVSTHRHHKAKTAIDLKIIWKLGAPVSVELTVREH